MSERRRWSPRDPVDLGFGPAGAERRLNPQVSVFEADAYSIPPLLQKYLWWGSNSQWILIRRGSLARRIYQFCCRGIGSDLKIHLRIFFLQQIDKVREINIHSVIQNPNEESSAYLIQETASGQITAGGCFPYILSTTAGRVAWADDPREVPDSSRWSGLYLLWNPVFVFASTPLEFLLLKQVMNRRPADHQYLLQLM